MKLTFNIIYTLGSVRYLAWFVKSLLRWSSADISYRLVSNGCSAEEETALQALCEQSERLGFLRLSSGQTLKHAAALNRLQALERSDLFCILDSDILATGDFLDELRPYFGQAAAVCSAHAIWAACPERYAPAKSRILRGSHHYAGDFCLGSTFLAVYDNHLVDRVIAKYGVGFDRFRQWKNVPAPARRALTGLGFGPKLYDTAKVLNLLLQAEGGKVLYKDSDLLVHIGGISKRPTGNVANRHDLLWYLLKGNWKGAFEVSAHWKDWPLLGRKAEIARYFTHFLGSLVEGVPFERRLRVSHPEIRQEVLRAAGEIGKFYAGLRHA